VMRERSKSMMKERSKSVMKEESRLIRRDGLVSVSELVSGLDVYG